PRARTDDGRSDDDAGDRKPPGQEPEALLPRRREDRVTVLRDEHVLDLGLRVPRSDSPGDQPFDLLGRRRVRLIERRPADGTHDLAFELGERGMTLTCARHGYRDQRGDENEHQLAHEDAIW